MIKFLCGGNCSLIHTLHLQGAVVDSLALSEALENGRIFAAGVDVVDGEPNVSADHPLVKQPRCVVLPHIGSATWDAREGMAMLCEWNTEPYSSVGFELMCESFPPHLGVQNVLAGIEGKEMPCEFK